MDKTKELLPEDTIIVWNKFPIGEYRRFFRQATGKEEIMTDTMDFQTWLLTQAGKTLKEALEEHFNPSDPKNMKELLSERRFEIISEVDKAFIVAFDEAINELRYDFGGSIGSGYTWSPLMIIYGKTGTKSRPCVARIYIGEGSTVLRLFFNNIDKHRAYIENAPEHIKELFFGGRDCDCEPKCKLSKARKIYTINDRKFEKCAHADFMFSQPNLEKLPDYIGLLTEFYPVKN